MNRSSKTRSSNYFSNTQLQAPNGKVGEVQHRSIEQSFTEDQVDSEAEPAFETQNYLYELQSRCNNLEYEKTKNDMAYQNIISELRRKNTYLQQVASTHVQNNQTLAEERDKVLIILSQVREQNYDLAKQIEGFKREVAQLEHSRGHSYDFDQDHLLDQLHQKDEEIIQRDKQINSIQSQLAQMETQSQSLHSESALILKKQINNLEKELETVKMQLQSSQKNQEILRINQRQKEELTRQLKAKDSEVNQMRTEKSQLQEELQRIKENMAMREKKTALIHSQQIKRLNELIKSKDDSLQEAENAKISLESKITQLTVEVGRLRSQSNGLQQYNKYLQGCNAENDLKRKEFQQEIYKSEKQISELRTSLFNEKLENKKLLSSIRLTFEEQKIRHVELMDQKSKEILKLKQLSVSSQRQNIDCDEISNRNQALTNELEKMAQMAAQLKIQNQTLKQDLSNLENKYDKKQEKYVNLEKELKAQYEKRIKSLESQIYRLQIDNTEAKSSNKNKNSFFPAEVEDDNSDLIELLKLQKKQAQAHVHQLQQRVKQYEQKLSKQQQIMRKLENQLRQLRDSQSKSYFMKSQVEERIKTINELQSQISRLNDEIRKERDSSSQARRQSSLKEQRLGMQLKKCQSQIENFNKNHKQVVILEKEITRLSSQLKERQMDTQRYVFQIETLKIDKESRKNNENSLHILLDASKKVEEKLQTKVKQLQTQIESLKQEKVKQNNKEKQLILEDRQKVNKSNEMKAENEVSLRKKCEELQKENYQLKIDYSDTLEELNSVLVKYKSLEQKQKKLLVKHEQVKNELLYSRSAKTSSDYLQKQVDQYKQTISSYQSQVQRLNQQLLEKSRCMNASYSPHFRALGQSKEIKRGKETQLWLNTKSQNNDERSYHSTINTSNRKEEYSYFGGGLPRRY